MTEPDATMTRIGKGIELNQHGEREYSTAELVDLFGVARSTVYRAMERERVRAIVGVGITVG
jgi:DNA-binding GntR family transcriptional regulator